MKMKTRKRYTDEFKARAVELVELGKPVSDVAKDLGLTTDLVYRWRREIPQRAQGGSAGQRAGGEVAEADELRALRRELAHLRKENDILKKGRSYPRHSSPIEMRTMIDSINQETGCGIRMICATLGLPRSSYHHAAKPTPTQIDNKKARGSD